MRRFAVVHASHAGETSRKGLGVLLVVRFHDRGSKTRVLMRPFVSIISEDQIGLLYILRFPFSMCGTRQTAPGAGFKMVRDC
jgi:hypothetical protein